ncbi:MAG: MarR family winged helix-turn-helix transcriptional regulator [Vagococcus sp.]|jgi:DNA-binding MarR family transcriptional regulator|nr:MarR family winged helix-turn-helix transcriptional regulator [Vagococcus sp.]
MTIFSKYSDSQESIGFVFWQTHMLWNREIKKVLTPLRLTHTQFVILSVINYLNESMEEVSQVDISELSKIDVMTISTSLKTLLKNDYIVRERSTNDSRAYILSLSSKGSDVLGKAMIIVEKVDSEFFKKTDISSKELLTIFKDLSSDDHA